ncbi:hypothetical protein BO99DRAFT_6226 [Aspergillus violaceofuscus CBS 115571]|uniref:Uncharacterized protein n=1 Tax=Aspergillus violaceofuscus (strain CBS 115571) TaxID=1450538 RepID=A0A2V5HLR0_ASPV1|nr:hypothetical protein BO99DRAFT_6226 [Aspergillus violaceofuscus CBS 115571]
MQRNMRPAIPTIPRPVMTSHPRLRFVYLLCWLCIQLSRIYTSLLPIHHADLLINTFNRHQILRSSNGPDLPFTAAKKKKSSHVKRRNLSPRSTRDKKRIDCRPVVRDKEYSWYGEAPVL